MRPSYYTYFYCHPVQLSFNTKLSFYRYIFNNFNHKNNFLFYSLKHPPPLPLPFQQLSYKTKKGPLDQRILVLPLASTTNQKGMSPILLKISLSLCLVVQGIKEETNKSKTIDQWNIWISFKLKRHKALFFSGFACQLASYKENLVSHKSEALGYFNFTSFIS